MSNSEHRRIEGLVTLISTEQVEKFAYTLLALLAREKSQEDQNIDACLRELACHVGDAARAQIYDVECNLLWAKTIIENWARKNSAEPETQKYSQYTQEQVSTLDFVHYYLIILACE